VVEALGVFRGRKTVALFSEGLDLTSGARGQFGDDRRSRFEELIARASHANVAFYTFDAAGLRLQTTATGQLMEEPRAGLSVLARETGGAFADGTNDLRPAVARMWADMQHYYLVTFDSARESDIGSVRVRVRVKVRGASVLVRERYGRVGAAPPSGTGKEPNP
jgi:VWFA-related protein